MIIRPIFFKCPNCGAYLQSYDLESGNMFGGAVYSDGDAIYPMLRKSPNLTKCEKCNRIIMLNQLEEVSEDVIRQLQEKESQRPLWNIIIDTILGTKESFCCYECEHLEISDLYKAVELFPEYELHIRLRIWRAYNKSMQPIIGGPRQFVVDVQSEEYQNNCLALLNILRKNHPEEHILMAELNRNLGNFEECLNVIRGSNKRGDLEKIIERECLFRNRYTVRTDNYYKELEETKKRIAKLEAERKEQERINEEMKDPRWKICPNGHCYENIMKECAWCGEDNVVGRLDKDTELQHKELYVGKQNEHYILSSDANIPMQEERIRKITIDYYQDKVIYFRIDGKNPHPFYFNTIRLDQGCIKGSVLTKLCENILKGAYDSVDISPYIEQNHHA